MLAVLSVILVGTLAWQGARYALRGWQENPESAPPPQSSPSLAEQDAWQRDVGVSLDEAVRHAAEGDLTQTEVAIDRATSILTVARLRSKPVPPEFYEVVIAQLDQILAAYHENTRLIEHVTLARIELAQLRSALESAPADTPSAFDPTSLLLPRPSVAENKPGAEEQSKPTGDTMGHSGAEHVVVGAPRELGVGSKLDPSSLGGTLLDATSMPTTAEILEPPSSRLFANDVRVENLTITGATQTLDGVHWNNVTFIGTRLRYEGGEVGLRNARFIHCMFGFTTDERGARIANAIASGKTTIVIE
ncbi:MAG: hypothetical protein WB987_03445 [Candidatus Acidiferrales bacterium]